MTILFSSMLVRGGNGSFSNPSDVVDLQASSSTVVATTQQQQDDEAIFLWIPLIVVIIFAAIIATLVIIGRQTNDACKCLQRVSPGLESGSNSCALNGHQNLQLNINVQINAMGPTFPETPPPSYSAITQQISYISSISQTSSQIEIPPDYYDALDIADGNSALCTKNRRFQPLSTRGPITFSQNQLLKSNSLSRIRLFSRSSSTSESPRRAALLRQSSTPTASEIVLETVEVPILDTSLNMTALDIILEATGIADDSRPSQNSENEDAILHRRDRQH